MDTIDSNKNEEKHKKQVPLENHLILRLPENLAGILNEHIENPDANKVASMSMGFSKDMRNVEIKVNDSLVAGMVVDLPTLVECYKLSSNNNSVVTKLSNIGQMIVCETEIPRVIRTRIDSDDFKWDSGLTPPMRDCRERCFRKIKKQSLYDLEDEDELAKILYNDSKALEFSYQIITFEPEETIEDALDRLQIKSDKIVWEDFFEIDETRIFGLSPIKTAVDGKSINEIAGEPPDLFNQNFEWDLKQSHNIMKKKFVKKVFRSELLPDIRKLPLHIVGEPYVDEKCDLVKETPEEPKRSTRKVCKTDGNTLNKILLSIKPKKKSKSRYTPSGRPRGRPKKNTTI